MHSRFPRNGYGGNITTWPAHFHHPPNTLQSIKIDAFLSRNDIYKAESNTGMKYYVTSSCVNVFRWKTLNIRIVMGMRAIYETGTCVFKDKLIVHLLAHAHDDVGFFENC